MSVSNLYLKIVFSNSIHFYSASLTITSTFSYITFGLNTQKISFHITRRGMSLFSSFTFETLSKFFYRKCFHSQVFSEISLPNHALLPKKKKRRNVRKYYIILYKYIFFALLVVDQNYITLSFSISKFSIKFHFSFLNQGESQLLFVFFV